MQIIIQHMKKYLPILLISAVVLFMSSCSKKNDTNIPVELSDYFPLVPGKYITYNLDSLVFINFGSSSVIRSYQVKYEVDAQIGDSLGVKTYRIFRYIRNIESNPWQPDATFMASTSKSSIQFVENNQRFIKLAFPLTNGFSWKGNSYIDTYSSNSEFQYLDDWDYAYDSIGSPVSVGNINLDNTLIVNQRDEIIGEPSDPGAYSEVNISKEKYAKGIGMVYRNFYHSEYQPGNGGYVADGSYGITLTMIDHN